MRRKELFRPSGPQHDDPWRLTSRPTHDIFQIRPRLPETLGPLGHDSFRVRTCRIGGSSVGSQARRVMAEAGRTANACLVREERIGDSRRTCARRSPNPSSRLRHGNGHAGRRGTIHGQTARSRHRPNSDADQLLFSALERLERRIAAALLQARQSVVALEYTAGGRGTLVREGLRPEWSIIEGKSSPIRIDPPVTRIGGTNDSGKKPCRSWHEILRLPSHRPLGCGSIRRPA